MTSPDWMRWVPPDVRPHLERFDVAGPLAPAAPHVPMPWPALAAAESDDELVTFAAGGRELHAYVHVPVGVDPGAAVPLVLMLHGCTQTAQAFAATTRMNEASDRHGFVVVYPQQERAENPQGCWNWFLPEHQGRQAGDPAILAGLVRRVIESGDHGSIDERRVFVAGFSAGGAMAATLAATHPDLFAAVAVHSGLAYRSASSVRAALATMKHGDPDDSRSRRAAYEAMGARARPLASIVVHGTGDRVVAPVNGQQVLRQTMASNRLAAPAECGFEVAEPTSRSRGRIDGGHEYQRSRWETPDGALMHELLVVEGLGHAWSGGRIDGSFADPAGPVATEAIWRFFAAQGAHREARGDDRGAPAGVLAD